MTAIFKIYKGNAYSLHGYVGESSIEVDSIDSFFNSKELSDLLLRVFVSDNAKVQQYVFWHRLKKLYIEDGAEIVSAFCEKDIETCDSIYFSYVLEVGYGDKTEKIGLLVELETGYSDLLEDLTGSSLMP